MDGVAHKINCNLLASAVWVNNSTVLLVSLPVLS
jgi:hypothetical protein